METIAFIRENNWTEIYNHGWGNGYVAIPKQHILYGKDYDEVFFDVTDLKGFINVHNIEYNNEYKTIDMYDLIHTHKGMTLSKPATEFILSDFAKSHPFEFLDDATNIKWENYWVFGFDTCHSDDNSQNCNKEYVIKMTRDLQGQLNKIDREFILTQLNK